MNQDPRCQRLVGSSRKNRSEPVDFEIGACTSGLRGTVIDRAIILIPQGGSPTVEQRRSAEVSERPCDAAFRSFAREQSTRDRVRARARTFRLPSDVAADITQAALIRLWHHRDRVESCRWPAWFHKTVLRDAYRYVRRRELAKKYEPGIAFELWLNASAPSPEHDLHLRECEAELLGLMESLRPERRAVVQLYLLEELPMGDVAAHLGIPEPTARNRWRLAQEDMGAAFQRARAKERFAAAFAAFWALLVALWVRVRGRAAPRFAPLLACACLAVVVADHQGTAPAVQDTEPPEALPSARLDYRLLPHLTTFAERERAAVSAAPAGGRGRTETSDVPRTLLAQAAAALLEGRPEVARSCLEQYRAAYSSDTSSPFVAQYRALAAQIGLR